MLDCCLREDPGAGLFGDWIEIARTKIKDSTDSNRLKFGEVIFFPHFVQGQMLSQGTLGGVDHLQGKSKNHSLSLTTRRWKAVIRVSSDKRLSVTIITDVPEVTHKPSIPTSPDDIAIMSRQSSTTFRLPGEGIPPKSPKSPKSPKCPSESSGVFQFSPKSIWVLVSHMCYFSNCLYWGLWSQQMNEYEQP